MNTDEPVPDWDDDHYGRRWGSVVFPELNDPELSDEELGSGVVRGWYTYEPATGSHTASPALSSPGVLDGRVSYTELSVVERRQMYLAFPSGQEHVGSREHLAEEIYWQATISSEGRIPWDFELFRHLLTDWVGTMQRRGLDPEQEMRRLLEVASVQVARWSDSEDSKP